LRFLHGKTNQIVAGQVDIIRRGRIKFGGQVAREDRLWVGSSRSLMRTSVPSRLISSAVFFRQTRVTLWPAIKSFVASNEPYEAPRMRILRAMVPRT
jgi:hypothetical protein